MRFSTFRAYSFARSRSNLDLVGTGRFLLPVIHRTGANDWAVFRARACFFPINSGGQIWHLICYYPLALVS